MEKIIAYCGLNCSECPAYIATQKNDYEEKARVAKEWSEMYKIEFKPEDLACNGCLATDGFHIPYCSTCEIRKCAIEKNVINCAYCSDYSCEKLEEFLKVAGEAKANLEEIRKSF